MLKIDYIKEIVNSIAIANSVAEDAENTVNDDEKTDSKSIPSSKKSKKGRLSRSESEVSIRDIKENIEQLEEVKKLLISFEKNQNKILQTHTKEHREFLRNVDDVDKKTIVRNISAIRRINSSLVMHDEITNKLELLAYNLGILKTTMLTKDYKTTRHIMKKLLTQEDTSIKSVIGNTQKFKEDVGSLRTEYNRLLSNAENAIPNLESKTELSSKNAALERLEGLHEKQKNILTMIAGEFAGVSKELLKSKEYKEFLKGN